MICTPLRCTVAHHTGDYQSLNVLACTKNTALTNMCMLHLAKLAKIPLVCLNAYNITNQTHRIKHLQQDCCSHVAVHCVTRRGCGHCRPKGGGS